MQKSGNMLGEPGIWEQNALVLLYINCEDGQRVFKCCSLVLSWQHNCRVFHWKIVQPAWLFKELWKIPVRLLQLVLVQQIHQASWAHDEVQILFPGQEIVAKVVKIQRSIREICSRMVWITINEQSNVWQENLCAWQTKINLKFQTGKNKGNY